MTVEQISVEDAACASRHLTERLPEGLSLKSSVSACFVLLWW